MKETHGEAALHGKARFPILHHRPKEGKGGSKNYRKMKSAPAPRPHHSPWIESPGSRMMLRYRKTDSFIYGIVLELIFILTTNNFSNVLEALKGC